MAGDTRRGLVRDIVPLVLSSSLGMFIASEDELNGNGVGDKCAHCSARVGEDKSDKGPRASYGSKALKKPGSSSDVGRHKERGPPGMPVKQASCIQARG